MPELNWRERLMQQAISQNLPATPAEELHPSNIAALEAEIARTQDPNIRALLIQEHTRIKALIPRFLRSPTLSPINPMFVPNVPTRNPTGGGGVRG